MSCFKTTKTLHTPQSRLKKCSKLLHFGPVLPSLVCWAPLFFFRPYQQITCSRTVFPFDPVLPLLVCWVYTNIFTKWLLRSTWQAPKQNGRSETHGRQTYLGYSIPLTSFLGRHMPGRPRPKQKSFRRAINNKCSHVK